ncbi:CPCC family cysteine-rich protein [Larkinella humicola]|uniref:Hydrolase n=1 Tax=Larkinella humicola TaxID=2607654 RepID=A0A5N1JFJ9_9BACT|nr:CPCC family cysteine-rich protein [Larkinella humicola]KAA9353046.1 hydrolase [Larkinella humicola]
MTAKSNKFGRYQCPCCEYFTYYEPPLGQYGICLVCWWEDDPIQLAEPDYEGGANTISLHQAQSNFKLYQVCDPALKHLAKKLNPQELPD